MVVGSRLACHRTLYELSRVVVSGANGERRWVLRRLNDRVFPDIVGLMENVGRVTRHLQARAAGPRQLSHGHHFVSGRPTASRIRS